MREPGVQIEKPAKFGRCRKRVCQATRRTALRAQVRHNRSNARG
jgi:hypothetical protein